MKIGIVAPGIWRSVHLDMAKALYNRGHQLLVYTEDARIPNSNHLHCLEEDGLVIYGIHHERRNAWLWIIDRIFKPLLGRRFFTTLFAIYKYLKKTRCDIYIVEGDWTGFFTAICSLFISIRWVVSIHDHENFGVLYGYPGEPNNWVRRLIKKWVLKRATAVRVNSYVTGGVVVASGIPKHKVHVIALHCTPRMLATEKIGDLRDISDREIKTRHKIPNDSKVVLIACRLTPFKGLELSLHAFAAAVPLASKGYLLVCGGDRQVVGLGSYKQYLQNLLDHYGKEVTSRVKFVGNVPANEMRKYYAAAHVHLVSSYVETFNYSALEAALVGTPTILTDKIGSGAWLEELGCAEVVPGREVDMYAAAISKYLSKPINSEDRQHIVNKTAERFSAANLSGEIERMIQACSAAH